MLCEEINKGVVNKLDREVFNDTAIRIRDGNFFWGLETKAEKKPSNEDNKTNKDEIVEEKEEPLIKKQEAEKSEGMISSTLTLKRINVEIKHGEFVCVIGDVGSGKSSLLSAIIGDMLFIQNSFLEKHGH
jgi:ABC-type glutathione transport system ATPase component